MDGNLAPLLWLVIRDMHMVRDAGQNPARQCDAALLFLHYAADEIDKLIIRSAAMHHP